MHKRKWAGSSFFSGRFQNELLVEAIPGELTSSNVFASWPGVETGPWHFVRTADSQGKCETIEGRQICPQEESFDYNETEYFRPGIDPFGHQYSFAASFSGGGFTTSFAVEERVALIASSFAGDDPGLLAPDSLVSAATPTPVPTAAALADPIFGPVDGALELTPGATQIPDFSSGVNVDSGVVQVLFVNPDVPSNKWTHGITFRQSAEEVFHAVFISSDGSWGHFARGGSTNNEVVPELGQTNFDTTPGGRNLLTLSPCHSKVSAKCG